MADFSSLLTIAGVWLLVVISPGPNFVATVHHAVSRSRRAGVLVALGVATGTALWVTVSIVGLGVLLVRMSWLVEMIRIIGALYLFFLGIRMIWKTRRQGQDAQHEQAPIQTPRRSAWFTGFLTTLGNPKTAAFFGSLFATLLPTHFSLQFQIACIATIVLISASWYSMVACLFSVGLVAQGYRRIKRWVDYLAGSILIALGVRLAVSK